MSDVVLVPTFARPEYLHLCLEHIRDAEGGREKRVWIAQDRHLRDDLNARSRLRESESVAAAFAGTFAELQFDNREVHGYIGNPFNFLELYRRGHDSDARFVYLIEDDVLVGPDFFRWHEAVQARGDYFCSVGWHCIRNPKALTSGTPEEYIESGQDFSSIGVCWKRENLAAIVQHARPSYYADLTGYMRATFPDSTIPAGQWTEQAGLIMRILLQTVGAKVAWAVVARCAHVGISGYHRRKGFTFKGPLAQRIDALRQAVQETSKLVSLSDDVFDDVSALPSVGAWDQLRVVQTFEGLALCN